MWGDDGSVGNNEYWLFVLFFQMLLNKSSDFLESSEGSVWDSNEEVLSGGTVSLFVINVVDAVDENDAEMLLQAFLVELE